MFVVEYCDEYPITKGMGQRAIADLIEHDLVERIVAQGGRKPDSVRTIEDVSYNGILIDIKTRDVDREFSMPNLISIDRLRKIQHKSLLYVFVDYRIFGDFVEIVNVSVREIHTIPWDCLSIQNIGLGQLQLSKYSDAEFDGDKKEWFEILKKKTIMFYKKQISKFQDRISEVENFDHFANNESLESFF